MEIPDIGTREIGIPPIRPVTDYGQNAPNVFQAPPVVVNIGVPVVDIPGCVEAHEGNSKSKTVGGDDQRGLVTYCDSGVPSFNPIQFEPEQLIYTEPAKVPKVPNSPKPPVPETPEIPRTPPQTAIVDQEETVETKPEIPWTEEYLPPLGTVTTTASIALVATTSALLAKPLADLLLKLIKPTIKKVVKKVSKMVGKKVKVESLRERRGQQRSRNKAVRILKGRE